MLNIILYLVVMYAYGVFRMRWMYREKLKRAKEMLDNGERYSITPFYLGGVSNMLGGRVTLIGDYKTHFLEESKACLFFFPFIQPLYLLVAAFIYSLIFLNQLLNLAIGGSDD